MSSWRRAAAVAIFAGIGAILALPPVIAENPGSHAALATGTDDAFAVSGMEPRENLVGGGALRWTRPRAAFRFESVGPGAVNIDLEIKDHRTEVNVAANGARIGSLRPGERRLSSAILVSGRSLDLTIETEGFEASGRVLGTQFVSLSVSPGPTRKRGPAAVPSRLWLAFGGVLLVAFLCAGASGLSSWLTLLPPAAFLSMALPAGLWRSSWLVESGALVAAGTIVATLAATRAMGSALSRSLLQACLLAAIIAHGILPPSPLVIQGDAQLHGNKLKEVAGGNRFPTTRTDHKPPFEIPYGVSFYGLFSPLASPFDSNVPVVRHASAAASALSIVALATLLGRTSAALAAATVLLWTFAPVNLRTMGYGNLSNVFAQATFVLFLVAAGGMPRGRLKTTVLTLLAAVSATAHLSSFIVLLTLLVVSFLVSSDRRSPAFRPLLAGVAIASVYFATFVPLIASQASRLLAERGGSSGVFDPWRLPNQIVASLGWPLLLALAFSLLVASPRPILPLAKSLLASGAVLAIVALVSPVEVRYLLAMVPLLAVLAAAACDSDEGPSFPRQTLSAIVDLPGLRALGSPAVRLPIAAVLFLAATWSGVRVLMEFVPLSGI